MGVMETKIVQVQNDPRTINESNEAWGRFGWSVLSVQVTHSQNTETYTEGMDYFTGDKTVKTTTINYATITYQRDKGMENYARIVELENEYERLYRELINYKPHDVDISVPSVDVNWRLIGIVVGICLLLCFIGGFAISINILIFFSIWQYRKYDKAAKAIQPEVERAHAERGKIIAKQTAPLRERIEEVLAEAKALL